MIDPAALAQYEQVVSALMSQDNAVRSQAEDAFNQLKQQPDVFFSGLIQLARQNANEQIRSLSAVLLRRVIGQTQPARDGEPAGVMARTSAPVAQLVKQELLAGVQSEQVRHIRKKLCECVASLGAGLLGGAGEWPELLPFMLEGTRSGNPALHEASLIIFGALSEFFAETDGMKAHHSTLLSVFTASLRPEQEITIRVAALKAVGSFLCALTDKASRKAFGDLAPFLLQTISDALANGQEDECRESIEVKSAASLTASRRRAAPRTNRRPHTPDPRVCARPHASPHAPPPTTSGARRDRRVATDVPQEDSPRVCRRHDQDHRQHRPRRRRAARHPRCPRFPRFSRLPAPHPAPHPDASPLTSPAARRHPPPLSRVPPDDLRERDVDLPQDGGGRRLVLRRARADRAADDARARGRHRRRGARVGE